MDQVRFQLDRCLRDSQNEAEKSNIWANSTPFFRQKMFRSAHSQPAEASPKRKAEGDR
jgi:hypothetical protein